MDHFFGTTLSVCETTRDLVPLAPLLAGGIQVQIVVNAPGSVYEVIVARERPDRRSGTPLQFPPASSRATETSRRAVRRHVTPQLIPIAGPGCSVGHLAPPPLGFVLTPN